MRTPSSRHDCSASLHDTRSNAQRKLPCHVALVVSWGGGGRRSRRSGRPPRYPLMPPWLLAHHHSWLAGPGRPQSPVVDCGVGLRTTEAVAFTRGSLRSPRTSVLAQLTCLSQRPAAASLRPRVSLAPSHASPRRPLLAPVWRPGAGACGLAPSLRRAPLAARCSVVVWFCRAHARDALQLPDGAATSGHCALCASARICAQGSPASVVSILRTPLLANACAIALQHAAGASCPSVSRCGVWLLGFA